MSRKNRPDFAAVFPKEKINNIYSLLQLFLSAFIFMTYIWSTIQPTTAHALSNLLFKPSRCHFSLCKNSLILSFGKGSFDAMEPGSSNRPQKKSRTEVVLKETKMDPEERIGSSAPLLVHEGVFAVHKPLEWTSNNVVGYIRKMLERDAKERGYVLPQKRGRKPLIKCGHGGTLDPLATGVLVIGIGRGTKVLQDYLAGTKRYRAGVKLGIQTTTLDLDPNGQVTETKSFDHVTQASVEQILPEFIGKIMQVPPIFSALKKDGKRLHEEARKGKTAEELEIEAREVEIFDLKMLPFDERGEGLPSCFGLEIECGGGTYVRSLVRDMGKRLGTVGTMSSLIRTKQGLFEVEQCLSKEDWTPENIYQAIEQSNNILLSREDAEASITVES